jgi:alpha-tubulin suppressor-like RCC1 family protein
VSKIAAGSRHLLLLTRRGEVLSCGFGSQGQLGRLPAFNNESRPADDLQLTVSAPRC